jgi:hypothetical protein
MKSVLFLAATLFASANAQAELLRAELLPENGISCKSTRGSLQILTTPGDSRVDVLVRDHAGAILDEGMYIRTKNEKEEVAFADDSKGTEIKIYEANDGTRGLSYLSGPTALYFKNCTKNRYAQPGFMPW